VTVVLEIKISFVVMLTSNSSSFLDAFHEGSLAADDSSEQEGSCDSVRH
jgi:hypothetical protein